MRSSGKDGQVGMNPATKVLPFFSHQLAFSPEVKK
jgi:hypothetical protein